MSVCSFNGILLCDVNWIKLKACASKSSFLYNIDFQEEPLPFFVQDPLKLTVDSLSGGKLEII